MKNLSRVDVKVSSHLEAKIARAFYKRACRAPENGVSWFHPQHSCYVGKAQEDKATIRIGAFDRNPKTEKIPFSRLIELADTPSRKKAYEFAFRSNGQTLPSKSREKLPTVPKVPKVDKLPKVRFLYPKSKDTHGKVAYRVVYVVKSDDSYIQGYEQDGQGNLKFKKYLLNRIPHVARPELLSYNS